MKEVLFIEILNQRSKKDIHTKKLWELTFCLCSILLDDAMHIKITDFGSAKIIDDQEDSPADAAARSFVGTAEYVSPELLKSDPVSKEADMWAFGCVIYQMLSGKSPFKAPTDYLIFQKIKNLEYTMPDEFSQPAKDIIQRLLTSDPEQRLGSQSLGGIQAIKDHPFFEGVDWDNIFTSTAPPLKERLEEEAKKHPVVSPKFDFDQVDDDEDIWFSKHNTAHTDPFRDRSPVIESPQIDDISPPIAHIEPLFTVSENDPSSNRSSFMNRNSVLQQEGSAKVDNQMNSATSSESVPERLGSHLPW